MRSSGGRNTLRHLMIPTYAASSEAVAIKALSENFPQGDDKIIVSIHSYTPYKFTMNPFGGDEWISDIHEKEIDQLFDKLRENFLDEGIPVILGEASVVNKNDNLESRVAWTRYYFGKAREF